MHNPKCRPAFTLVEVMISLGLLVLGLSMVATAFPVALSESKDSLDDSMSSIIVQNALSICRTRWQHSKLDGSCSSLTNMSFYLGANDMTFPVPLSGDAPSRYGFLVAARQINSKNLYQVAVVPYRKFHPNDAVKFSDATVSGTTVSGGNVANGSPVISVTDGSYATAIRNPNGSYRLSRQITGGQALTVGNAAGGDSPAIGCCVTLCSFRPGN